MKVRFPNNFFLIVVGLLFFVGCYSHYRRGSYGIGIRSLSAKGIEDAYISYRYGWNLTHYDVLSWNESGYRRTEGFTNPLWVYISAGWALLGHKEWIYPLMTLTSILFTAGILIALFIAVKSVNDGSVNATLGLGFLAITPALWLHTTSGLESAVFGVGLALLAYLSVFADRFLSRILFVIVPLTIIVCLLRSDGFIYVTVIILATIIVGSHSWKWVGIGLLIGILLIFLWRFLSFGTFLPTTAIAKVNFPIQERLSVASLILLYVVMFSGISMFVLFGLAGVFLEPRRIWLGCVFIILGWVGYYLYIGGDYLMERHLINIFAFGAALSAPLWYKTRLPVQILLAALILSSLFISLTYEFERYHYWLPKTKDPWIMLGKEMSKNRAYYGVLLTSAAGKIPFYAGGDCIDIYGLNDPYLAILKRASFFPGHSAGSEESALQLAQSHPSGVYSRFTNIDSRFINHPDKIALWILTRNPQDLVQKNVTTEDWEEALQTDDPYYWSIITKPVEVNQDFP